MAYDDYSLQGHPCFGTYDSSSDCWDCKYKTACKYEARHNDERRSFDALPVKRLQPVKKPQPENNRSRQIIARSRPKLNHLDFTPYEGESLPARVGKNILLEMGATVMQSLAQFFMTYTWEPKMQIIQYPVHDAEQDAERNESENEDEDVWFDDD